VENEEKKREEQKVIDFNESQSPIVEKTTKSPSLLLDDDGSDSGEVVVEEELSEKDNETVEALTAITALIEDEKTEEIGKEEEEQKNVSKSRILPFWMMGKETLKKVFTLNWLIISSLNLFSFFFFFCFLCTSLRMKNLNEFTNSKTKFEREHHKSWESTKSKVDAFFFFWSPLFSFNLLFRQTVCGNI
jgi:hypothetical protein